MISRRQVLVFGGLAAVSMAAYLWAANHLYGLGFPLDDAWIHQTYARSLAQGGGWAFTPGQPSAGLTAPLWAALLAVGHWLGFGPFTWTFLLGWLLLWSLAAVGVWTYQSLLPDANPKTAWLVGLVLLFEWHLVWAALSGMETLLFALLVVLVLAIAVQYPKLKRGALLMGGLIGISVWVRPEGLTLLGPALFVIWLGADGWRARWRDSGILLSSLLVLFGPYLLFNRWLAGSWWPNTFYAKQAEYAVLRALPFGERLLQQFGLTLVGVGILLLPGFIKLISDSLRARCWGPLAGGLWVLGSLVIYALRLPVIYQHGRYAMPVMAPFFLWGLAGMIGWIKPGAARPVVRWLSRAWQMAVPLLLAGFWLLGLGSYSRDVGIINTEMVAAARWVADNTAPDTLIAAHDIGALGYFAQRPLLDLAGLVSPEVIPFIRDEAQLRIYLDAHQPAYLITFPNWYPDLTAQVESVYDTGGRVSPAAGGENMTVYRWSQPAH